MLQWERGRLLAAYGNNKYSYNADGIRIKKKTAEGVLHTYFTEGTRIHCERFLNHTNWYYYDATGITGMEHDGVRYFFQKNVQGDVMRIFDSCGRLIARYAYDAWGNHTVYDANGNAETAYNFIGNINPFRYRGYYFDVETGLYYLNTRYYDPSICRFINADDISYIEPETINGLNLYAYCGNNPVMAIDPNGTAWWHWVAGALAIVGAALVIGAITVLTCGVGTLAGTMLGAAIYGAAQGVAIGAAVGVIGGGIIGGIASDWSAEGILTGMGIGLGVGAIIGGVIGGLAGVKSFTANSAYLTKYQHNVKQVLSSFKGNPKLSNVQKGTKAFRVHGGKSNAIGSWVSPKIYSNPVSKLALDPKWGNTASELSTLLFNQDALILVGKAAAQGALKGGGIQWFLGDTLWLSLFL